MFSILVKMKDGHWIDLDGIPDMVLGEALKEWSNGSEYVKINSFKFESKNIDMITILK